MQETETQTPVTETLAPEPQPSPEPSAAEVTPTQEAEPETFDIWLAQTQAEDFRHKKDWETYVQERKGEGWQEAITHLKPQVEYWQQETTRTAELYQQANDGFRTMHGRLLKLAEEGIVDEEHLGQVLRSVPNAWAALQGIGAAAHKQALDQGVQQGSFDGGWAAMEFFIDEGAKAAGKPALHAKLAQRVAAGRLGQETPLNIVKEFVEEVRQAGFQAGLKEGRSGATEAEKATSRPGQGPSTVGKGPGGKSYTTETEIHVAHANHEITTAKARELLAALPRPER